MGISEDRGWELESAEERHAASPATFEIPSLAERSSLAAGQMVKLLFLFRNEDENGEPVIDCERMWVTITDASANRYSGILESVPGTSDALCQGDVIQFSAEHVCAVFIPLTAPSHPGYVNTRLFKWWRALVRFVRPSRREA
jgi:hypothetical protein